MERFSALTVICTVTSYLQTTFKNIPIQSEFLFVVFICFYTLLHIAPEAVISRDGVTLSCRMMMMIALPDCGRLCNVVQY